jgi:hypothetical protein
MNQSVIVKPKDRSNFGGLLSGIGMVGGAVAAPFTGGASLLPAIAAGAGLGSAGGKLVGSGIDAVSNAGPEKKAIGGAGNSAIQRRLEERQGSNPLSHVEDAMSVVGALPPYLQQQYGPPLQQAMNSGQPQWRVTNQKFKY